ncbi:MAG: putative quinol monooxygenase [Myxococcota bacterium]
MIVIRVVLDVKPAMQEAFEKQMRQEQDNIPTVCPGCLRFRLYRDSEVAQRYMLYEEWDNRESAEAYMASDLFKANGQLLFPMLAGKPDTLYVAGEPWTR